MIKIRVPKEYSTDDEEINVNENENENEKIVQKENSDIEGIKELLEKNLRSVEAINNNCSDVQMDVVINKYPSSGNIYVIVSTSSNINQ